MSTPRGKILVIRGGAIGDFILTLPAIAAVRRQFPEAHLELLGYPHIAQLAEAGGLVDRVQAIEARGLAGFFARNGDLSEDLRDYFSEFNLVISYLFDPDEIFRTNVARCGVRQFIAGPHRPDESRGHHATQVFLKPLEQLAIFDVEPCPVLSVSPVANPAIPLLALHPGSGSDRKNWSEENWSQLIERILTETSVQLLVVGGEAEADRLQRLVAALPPTRVTLAKNLPLVELARRLSSCCGFVGHDSGITHLAAALGLPCVVLWANTNEAIWRPQGTAVQLLRDPNGLAGLNVSCVFTAVASLLPTASV